MNKTFSKYPDFSVMDIILLPLLAIIVCSCGGGKNADATGSSASINVELAVADGQLPLPDVPVTITDTKQRATYVVTHFWDNMNFSDTIHSRNRNFVEQNFSNYVSIFSLVDREQLLRAVTHLMISAEADRKAFGIMADVAEKYLYEPDSPMFNEENYELFLPAIISSDMIDQTSRQHYMYQQECINKNRRGSIAADFSYSDVRGRLHTLWTTNAADRLLLLFFDPECDHCKEIMTNIGASCELTKQVNSGRLSVMAICASGDKSHWADVKNSFPSNWIVGIDNSNIDDKRIYVLRGMPTIYVLDAEKRVVLKDVRVEAAMNYLIEGQKTSQQQV
jgi:hypothetical protein